MGAVGSGILLRCFIIKKLTNRMIDYQQIDELLKSTKLSSMTDVIHFVLDNLVKVINFQPIQDLAARITDLEKPQGLDSIMLEQVKTLIQAMLQQKQQQLVRDLQRTVHRNVFQAIEQESNRTSLRQIDLMELMSNQNSRKASLTSQAKLSASNTHQSQIDAMRKEINEMRIMLERKSDRREVKDLKIDIQKQLSCKMAVAETEKVVEKFQKEIFNKITETSTMMQKIEYDVKKSLLNEVCTMKKELNQGSKMVELKEKLVKAEKKVKKISNQTSQSTSQVRAEQEMFRKQTKQSIDQICSLIEKIDSKIKGIETTIKALNVKVCQTTQNSFQGAAWISQNKTSLKNMSIGWEKEVANESEEIFKFQTGKSQIITTEPGYYKVESYISGCEKPPQLHMNSQPVLKFVEQEINKSKCFSLSQTIKMSESINKLWVRLDNQTYYQHAMLRITKIG